MKLDRARSLLESRIEIVKESATRSRYALGVNVAAATALLSVLFNTYFSWNRISFAYRALPPFDPRVGATNTRVLREQLLRSWIDAQTFSVPILGIKVQANDVTMVGSLILGVLAVWLLFCARREHLSLAGVLSDSFNFLKVYEGGSPKKHAERLKVLYYIYTGVTSQMIFTVLSDDRPLPSVVPMHFAKRLQAESGAVAPPFFRSMVMINRLEKQTSASVPSSLMSEVVRLMVRGMYYLPMVAVAAAGILEVLTILPAEYRVFHSPFRTPAEADKVVGARHVVFLSMMALVFAFNALVCAKVGAIVSRYNQRGRDILRDVATEIVQLLMTAGMLARDASLEKEVPAPAPSSVESANDPTAT